VSFVTSTSVFNSNPVQFPSPSPLPDSPHPQSQEPSSTFNISIEETIRRLRAKGQPIRLFGESDKDRRLRLRALELIEEKDSDRRGGQNDFKKALEDVESIERQIKNRSKGKKKEDTNVDSAVTSVLDLALVKTDPDKLYPIIYYALKRTLKEWEEAMDDRPGESSFTLLCFLFSVGYVDDHTIEQVKRSMQGKLAAATQVQSAEYLKPLFRALRSRVSHPRSFLDSIFNMTFSSLCNQTFSNGWQK
jgi:pre-mRNA-splicing factor 18